MNFIFPNSYFSEGEVYHQPDMDGDIYIYIWIFHYIVDILVIYYPYSDILNHIWIVMYDRLTVCEVEHHQPEGSESSQGISIADP